MLELISSIAYLPLFARIVRFPHLHGIDCVEYFLALAVGMGGVINQAAYFVLSSITFLSFVSFADILEISLSMLGFFLFRSTQVPLLFLSKLLFGLLVPSHL